MSASPSSDPAASPSSDPAASPSSDPAAASPSSDPAAAARRQVARLLFKRYSVLPSLSTSAFNEPAENYRTRAIPFGMVQMFLGVTIAMLVILIGRRKLLFLSGAFVWAPLMPITAGSLTMFAGRLPFRSLVKPAVYFNAVATVTSMAASTIFLLDANSLMASDPPYENDSMFDAMLSGNAGVLSFLEMFLSFYVVLGSGSICNSSIQVNVNNPLYNSASASVETPPTNQTPPPAVTPPPPPETPPEYSSITI